MKDYRDRPNRSAVQVLQSLHKPAMEAARSSKFTEAPMLKARCRRLTNRSEVVGKTVFNFDSDGICEVPDVGNARYDYERLLQMNGVTPVVDAPPKPAVPAPTPAPKPDLPVIDNVKVEAEASVEAPKPAPVLDDDKAEAETKRETKVSVEMPKAEADDEDKPKPRRRAVKKKK